MDGLLTFGDQIDLKLKDGNDTYTIRSQQQLMFEYLKILGLAHEVVKDKPDQLEHMGYQGPSPDEIAMVETAAERGFTFIKNLNQNAVVRVEQRFIKHLGSSQLEQLVSNRDDQGSQTDIIRGQMTQEISYRVLRRMEFSSDRKRMSILVYDEHDCKYKLYMKGADSIVFDRLAD